MNRSLGWVKNVIKKTLKGTAWHDDLVSSQDNLLSCRFCPPELSFFRKSGGIHWPDVRFYPISGFLSSAL